MIIIIITNPAYIKLTRLAFFIKYSIFSSDNANFNYWAQFFSEKRIKRIPIISEWHVLPKPR